LYLRLQTPELIAKIGYLLSVLAMKLFELLIGGHLFPSFVWHGFAPQVGLHL